MYNDLCKNLAETYLLVDWYALGEAKRLAVTIAQVVKHHRENPNEEESRQILKATANKTVNFLDRMGNNQKPLKELRHILTAIELEI